MASRMFGLICTYAFASSGAAPTQAQSLCGAFDRKIAEVNDRYSDKYRKIESEAQELSKRAGALSDDDLENLVGVDIDIIMRNKSVIFDIPSVTLKDRRLVFGVPQVEMRLQTIRFDVPKTTFVLKKTGQYPEFVCHDTWVKVGPAKTKGVPNCTTKWSDILTKIPEVRMETTEIKAEIPEFKIDDVSVVVKVPEVFMQRQEVVFHVPEIKSADLTAEQRDIEDSSSRIAGRADETQMQHVEEVDALTVEMYDCYLQSTRGEKARSIGGIDIALAEIEASIKEMVAVGVDPERVQSTDGVINLITLRDQVLRSRLEAITQFDAVIDQIESQRQEHHNN